MGRRTATSFDDELSNKMRSVVCDVLDRLHRHGELEHVRALYPPSTQARIDNSSHLGEGGTLRESEKFPYTFEHFVEHLDPADGTFYNLMELLITLTARKAIASAAERGEVSDVSVGAPSHANSVPFPSSSSHTTSVPSLHATGHSAYRQSIETRLAARHASRTTRECQREMMLSRAVQSEIRTITRRNRRSHRSEDSDTSSDSLTFTSPPLTRTVFSTLVDASGGESNERANAAATTRAARVGHGGGSSGIGGEQGYHWIQRDLSSIRRRLDQRRDEIIGRSNSVRGSAPPWITAMTGANSAVQNSGNPTVTSNIRANEAETDGGALNIVRRPSSHATTVGTANADNVFVRRFLSQPFPSDTRRSSSAMAPTSTVARDDDSNSVGLNATLAPQRWSPPSPVLFTSTSATLDPADVDVIEDADAHAVGRNASDTNNSGAQARLEAVQAALNRLSSSASPSAAAAAAIDPIDDAEADNATMQSIRRRHYDRTGEFEAFSARRRGDHRASTLDASRVSGRRNDDNDNDSDAFGTFTFSTGDDLDASDTARMETAVFRLIRADDTIRRITDAQGRDDHGTNAYEDNDVGDDENDAAGERHETIDGGPFSGPDPLTRRLELPIVEGRSVVRLPPRSRTRSFHRNENATL